MYVRAGAIQISAQSKLIEHLETSKHGLEQHLEARNLQCEATEKQSEQQERTQTLIHVIHVILVHVQPLTAVCIRSVSSRGRKVCSRQVTGGQDECRRRETYGSQGTMFSVALRQATPAR